MSAAGNPTASTPHTHAHPATTAAKPAGHSHVHAPSEGGVMCCSHHQLDERNAERWLVVYALGAMLLVAALFGHYVVPGAVDTRVVTMLELIAAVLLSSRILLFAYREIITGYASSSSLAALALLGCLAIEKYATAGWVALILLVADTVLKRTAASAQRAIEGLVRLTPNVARVVRDGEERELPLAEVRIGDLVRVRPGENLPVDGTVVKGLSTIDQASLTGEAAPHEVDVGDEVYAGTTNLSGLLDIRATSVGSDSTIGKVTQLIAAAERTKTPRQLLIEQVARFYVPVVLSLAFLTWFLTPDKSAAAVRAITVLFVACPSALLISSPTALVAAFASAARLGVMIKEPRFLEACAGIDTVVFDKTGTITTGKFAVSRLAPAPGVDGAELLSAAAHGEAQSNHPLARSILTTAQAARIAVDASGQHEEVHGRGVRSTGPLGTLYVGRPTWLAELFPNMRETIDATTARVEGMTAVHVVRQQGGEPRYLGCVGLEDKIRPNTRAVIEHLRQLGVRRVSIFTGDRLAVAERVGRAVGADALEAECLPAEKHEQIAALVASGRRTMMVGDGINDGPSLAAADVGVAMGLGGSDIATNSAGVALMNDDLGRVPFLIELARMNRTVIGQNITISVLTAIVGLALAASGTIEIFGALLFHFLGDVLVILNSFRLFRFGENYAEPISTDAPSAPARREASVTRLQPA
jgi:heavy metal translocating P-type ATPase